MTRSRWLDRLNAEQQEAVLHTRGPLLILAGAGSGKTTVLVARTGRLIDEERVPGHRLAVLTFTNKAAQELKHRVAAKVGAAAEKVWAGTFHGFGLQFLKENHEAAGLPRNFGLLDGGDSESVVKELLKEHKHSEKEGFQTEVLLEKIHRLRAGVESTGNLPEDEMAEWLRPKYLRRLRDLGVVDFEELLLRPLHLAREKKELRDKLQDKFDFVMVDEFQDTNKVQMSLLDVLTEQHRNLAVVGDDDQSIYGWRGAEIQNILTFPKRYRECRVVRLEQNYRSAGPILNLANKIISQNTQRHTKVLRSGTGRQGGLPELFVLDNEEAEVDFLVQEIQKWKRQGRKNKEIAVLYRSNSQGGLFEGGLRKSGIPYKITGGAALFDRKEVKDLMAYLRVAFRPHEVAVRRVLNLPARGIGEKAIEAIESFSSTVSKPVDLSEEFFRSMKQGAGFSAKAMAWAYADSTPGHEGLQNFLKWLSHFRDQLSRGTDSAETLIDRELRSLGYRKLVEGSYKDLAAADSRWMALLIVGRILDGFFKSHGRSEATLVKFLDSMELRDLEDPKEEAAKDEVQMMTLHACKGLEFPVVLLCGLEEDILPHARLGQDVDEERRLFYVGVTRAQDHLIMTRTLQRKKYGRNQPTLPSRFLAELDPALFSSHHGPRAVTANERQDLMANLFARLDARGGEKARSP